MSIQQLDQAIALAVLHLESKALLEQVSQTISRKVSAS